MQKNDAFRSQKNAVPNPALFSSALVATLLLIPMGGQWAPFYSSQWRWVVGNLLLFITRHSIVAFFSFVRHSSSLFSVVRHSSSLFSVVRHSCSLFSVLRHSSSLFSVVRHSSRVFSVVRHFSSLWGMLWGTLAACLIYQLVRHSSSLWGVLWGTLGVCEECCEAL